MLRVTILCSNGEAVCLAMQRVIATFDLREGNGRMKNLLNTKKLTPPRVLTNCVVRVPGCPQVTAEIQIHFAAIKKLADAQHRYYEIKRAGALSELLAEAEAQAAKEREKEETTEEAEEETKEPELASVPAPTALQPSPGPDPCLFWCDT